MNFMQFFNDFLKFFIFCFILGYFDVQFLKNRFLTDLVVMGMFFVR